MDIDWFVIGFAVYEFLAMSNSQLRDHACWLFAPLSAPALDASEIRRWMGDFSGITNVAKYAARMGQCFSSTVTSRALSVTRDEWQMINDIKITSPDDKEYTFSDGIGRISEEVQLCIKKSPSLFIAILHRCSTHPVSYLSCRRSGKIIDFGQHHEVVSPISSEIPREAKQNRSQSVECVTEQAFYNTGISLSIRIRYFRKRFSRVRKLFFLYYMLGTISELCLFGYVAGLPSSFYSLQPKQPVA